jgi:hypothetical protein
MLPAIRKRTEIFTQNSRQIFPIVNKVFFCRYFHTNPLFQISLKTVHWKTHIYIWTDRRTDCLTAWKNRGDLVPPPTFKRPQIFVYSARYLCPILKKFRCSRQVFVEVLNINIQGNPPRGRCLIYVDGRTRWRSNALFAITRKSLKCSS